MANSSLATKSSLYHRQHVSVDLL